MAKRTRTTTARQGAKPSAVTFEAFKSLNEMITKMDTRPPNAVFKVKDSLSSQRDESDVPMEDRFTGTANYKEAMDIMKAGYKEPLEKMKRAILKIGNMDNFEKPKMKADFVGFVPHVPNTVMNLPITMINRERKQAQSKTIHLTYNFAAVSNVPMDEIIKAGINFISLVNSLEKQGYRVKIDLISAAVSGNETPWSAAVYSVTLKEYGQSLNLLKLAFPLIHPAMFRRVTFKWLETHPDIKNTGFRYGYGTTLGILYGSDLNKEREFLKEHKIIKDSFYINVYEASRAKDINELAQKIGIVR